jgi:hypothetical protein
MLLSHGEFMIICTLQNREPPMLLIFPIHAPLSAPQPRCDPVLLAAHPEWRVKVPSRWRKRPATTRIWWISQERPDKPGIPVALNSLNNKIPAMIDPARSGGAPLALFELVRSLYLWKVSQLRPDANR